MNVYYHNQPFCWKSVLKKNLAIYSSMSKSERNFQTFLIRKHNMTSTFYNFSYPLNENDLDRGTRHIEQYMYIEAISPTKNFITFLLPPIHFRTRKVWNCMQTRDRETEIIVQRQTALITYFSSQLLLLFTFAQRQTSVTANL